MRKTGLTALLTVAMITATMPGALAKGGVVDHQKVTEQFQEVDPWLSDACGTEVTVAGEFTFDVRVFADGSVKDHHSGAATFSSEYGAITLSVRSMIHFEPEQFVDNGDGTATVTVPHKENVMIRLQAKGAPPSAMDAGVIQWWIEVTIDTATGELLAFDEDVLASHGQFSLLTGDADFVDVVCGALSS